MRKLTSIIGLVLILALGLVASVGRPQPARAATGDNLVLVWNEETLESIRKLPPAPTVATRALAIVHTAIYDAGTAHPNTPWTVGGCLVISGLGVRVPRPAPKTAGLVRAEGAPAASLRCVPRASRLGCLPQSAGQRSIGPVG